MSREELQELVHAFHTTLGQLRQSGTSYMPGGSSKSVEVAAEQSVQGASQAPLQSIREKLGDCQRCPLSKTRTQIVFGTGCDTARLMFVGEAPGADEDRLGEPFVGAAGQLLDKMIVAMGWSRDSVYIANVLKCRPPNNRDPEAIEVSACEGVLAAQIAVIKPDVIVTLGKPAAHLLLGTKDAMGRLRGTWQTLQSGTRSVQVMPTYHPAYLLREPSKKRDVWSDLQQVMRFFEPG